MVPPPSDNLVVVSMNFYQNTTRVFQDTAEVTVCS